MSSPSGLAFIFDLDGVIVDSTPVHTETWRRYSRSRGVELPENFETRMLGRHNDDIVGQLFGPDLTADAVFQHGAAKEALYRELMRPVLAKHLIPGVISFLRRHPDIPKAVASNAEAANLAFVLENAGIRELFDTVLDGAQVAQPKPAPDIYLYAAAQLGVEPRNAIIFEDSQLGIQAAQAAGGRVVGIRTAAGDVPGVALTIDTFLDPRLEPWLASQKPLA